MENTGNYLHAAESWLKGMGLAAEPVWQAECSLA
jgi:hypothetical protein